MLSHDQEELEALLTQDPSNLTKKGEKRIRQLEQQLGINDVNGN